MEIMLGFLVLGITAFTLAWALASKETRRLHRRGNHHYCNHAVEKEP